MENLSKENIEKNCPHCNRESFAFKHPLEETQNFLIICDAHPLVEGHILIVPKDHYSCIGEYPDSIFKEFKEVYDRVSAFIKENYRFVCSFEHGKIGQTVFHSHVHLLPCNCRANEIVPEGSEKLIRIKVFEDLIEAFDKDGQYLFFSIEDDKWLVDCSIGAPRFFRDRFAKVLKVPKRANWKEIHSSKDMMLDAERENSALIQKWNNNKQVTK